MIKFFRKRSLKGLIYLLLFIVCGILPIACNSGPSSAQTLTVGVSPWPGYAGHYVAMAKDMFKTEGVTVKEIFFPNQGDSDAAFLAGKVDLSWQGLPNAVMQISRDPSIKIVFQCDYSNGADGILGRNIKKPADLKGQKVARENILFEELILRRYLEKMGLTREDVTTVDLTAADAAAAFTAGKVNIAVTFEPWMTKAASEGKGEVVFSTKDTNIVPDGLMVRDNVLQNRQAELQAYLRAIDKATKLIKAKPSEFTDIIAKNLSIQAAEVPEQMAGVKLYDLDMNKTLSFNASEPMGLFNSIDFASKSAKQMNLIPQEIDVKAALVDSVVKSL
ncbi:ABC transporter substrate-binding protein [Gloeothece verrucosa]|uniref:NMT1/THI5 like domain protein n=1 Tax=Gloeothece verrucosa (strain PCC 7822) TaxID=497965 RepID=E0U614_GLOV7|nr:ABC transporter substrate-binding protein [Gloeothece verrucosa]ADN17123.1 NMT1/THI5 like domain protein [Gloeothece verrucosa PCC 7822]